MTLSEELSWRGFVYQSTFDDIKKIDSKKYKFYWGVDPSADSMQVGNLAMAMMVKHFMNYGHKPYLLVGGATGMIGDPDGKATEREIQSKEQIASNKKKIANQYKSIFAGDKFTIVDNFDWFKEYCYLDFLRDVGKHVPMRQMLGREFVQSRLSEEGGGISYAEFSYVLIQAFDFLHLHREYGVDLQVCGSDQLGNSIAGVDLIRRLSGDSADVWAGPLIVNPHTGKKFGKSENGAIWLDPSKTSVTSFYQFWVNSEDDSVEHYLKIFTLLTKEEISAIMQKHKSDPKQRYAQSKLAEEVTKMVHGNDATDIAQAVTGFITGKKDIANAKDRELSALKSEIATATTTNSGSVIQALVDAGLASSNSEARSLLSGGAIYLDNMRISKDKFTKDDFKSGRLILRRGKAYKDSALVELSE